MTAGLLVCDYTLPKWQAQFGDYSDMFTQLFPEFDWRFYEVQKGQFPKNVEDCEVYFSTGSRHSVYDDLPWIAALKVFIQELQVREHYFVGFCFGHQILGEALGGKVEKAAQGWSVGVQTFEIKSPKAWMQPFQDQINLLMMCQDQIIKLPPQAEVLGSSDRCPIGLFQVGEKMLGIQAHPEFSKAYDRVLMESRRHTMGDTIVDGGIASLEMEVHRAVIRNWVLRFLGE
ncbi:MAG: amidotransferase [Bacteroidota bacterium]